MPGTEKHIAYTAADIEKYVKGELSPDSMHAMELAALEDPFLADAMEGFGAGSVAVKNVRPDMEDLQSRLSKRMAAQSRSKVIAGGWWKIAAAVVVLAGAGWLFTVINNQHNTSSLAKNEAPKEITAPPATPALRDSTGYTDPSPTVATRKSPPSTQNKSTAGSAAANKPGAEPKVPLQAATQSEPGNEALTRSDVETKKTRNVRPAPTPDTLTASRLTAENTDLATTDKVAGNTFNGFVMDQSQQPVANAAIQIPGLKISTQTNQKGYFSFRAPDSSLNVSIASAGYEPQNLRLENDDAGSSINYIRLKPVLISLDEARANGYGPAGRKQTQAISIAVFDAEPVIGWDAYRQYLEQHKKTTGQTKDIHGNVVVSFEVRSKGLYNFDIEESLNDDLDEEAIRLIKHGPEWKLLKGKKAKTSVVVKF